MADHRSTLSAASRDGHLALRRVERHQLIIERLQRAHGEPISLAELSTELGVSTRTLARDVERLRDSGVSLQTRPGPGGGVRLAPITRAVSVEFDLAEAAAVMSSLAVLGPTVTPGANAAMRKLTDAVELAQSSSSARCQLNA